jgi:hypothetical protein
LTEVWGDLVLWVWPEAETAGEVTDIEEVEEALECVW